VAGVEDLGDRGVNVEPLSVTAGDLQALTEPLDPCREPLRVNILRRDLTDRGVGRRFQSVVQHLGVVRLTSELALVQVPELLPDGVLTRPVAVTDRQPAGVVRSALGDVTPKRLEHLVTAGGVRPPLNLVRDYERRAVTFRGV